MVGNNAGLALMSVVDFGLQVWQQHLRLNTHRSVSSVHVEHLPRAALSSER